MASLKDKNCDTHTQLSLADMVCNPLTLSTSEDTLYENPYKRLPGKLLATHLAAS